ncbi:acyl carrier protein [Mycolicibacterium hippocampi]|uniref:acyl carrier protein n=1 Tax=Mycolicibacterium hippocampi TaxID=659824 RepID=UPI003514A358
MTDKRDVTNDNNDPEFDRLIEQSSLGTAAARRLRSRVSAAQVDRVRRRLTEQDQTQHSDSSADMRIAVSNSPAGQREIFVSFKWTHASVTASVREIVADALRVSQDGIDVDQPLIEQGLDSLTMVEIRAVMEKSFGVELPAALLWEQPPTVVQLADCILAQHSGGRPKPVDPQNPFTLGPRDSVTGKFSKDDR